MSNLVSKKPKVALLESIRSIGYNFNSALADIIDNSISANAKKVDIFLIESIPAIAICDDGCGMSFDELDIAMDLGSKSPELDRDENDLGRFGLGMKSASFSQCKCLTVSSLKNNNISSMTWDLDVVQKEQEWLLKINNEDEINNLPYINYLKDMKHGTIVQWSNFDRIKISNVDLKTTLLDNLLNASKYLALVFHKYLSEKKIQIRINNNELKILDPFLMKKGTCQHLKTQPILMNSKKGEKHIIKVTPHILPFYKDLSEEDYELLGGKDNIKNEQGFYIYRNKRLIIWGTWLHMVGKNELYKNARVEVEIPNSLDDIWEVDVKKASASIPGTIREQLIAKVKEAIGGSKRIYKKRGEKLNAKKDVKTVWNVSEERDTYEFKINRKLPLIEELLSDLSEDKKALLNALLSDIETNIPKMQIYTTIAEAKDKKVEDDEKDLVLNNINEILNGMTNVSKIELISFLEMIFHSEPYCDYPEILEDLKKELNENE